MYFTTVFIFLQEVSHGHISKHDTHVEISRFQMNLFVENVTYVTSDVNIRDIHKLIKVQIVLLFGLRYDR